MELPVCNITDFKNLVVIQKTIELLEYKQQSFIKLLWENLTVSQDDIFVNKEVLDLLSLTIDDLKCLLPIKVIHNCRYYNHDTKEWVGKRGYWLSLRKEL